MSPLVRAGLLAALCSALAVLAARAPEKRRIGTPAEPAPRTEKTPAAPCPRGTLPDANVCVPVPAASTAPSASTGARELPP